MLRSNVKSQIIHILNSVAELWKKGKDKDEATLISILQELQDSIILIKKCLIEGEEESKGVITLMNSLLEFFDLLSKNVNQKEDYIKSRCHYI